MKAGDIAEVRGPNYVGNRWLNEGKAKLIQPIEEGESLPSLVLRTGEEISGPFQRWEVEWQDEDGGVSCRWIREEDIIDAD